MDIKNLLQNPDVSQRKAAKTLVSKWERTGLLEGLRTETEVAGMSQLLENQARQLVKEASSTGTSNGSEEWAGVALPLVRRIFAEFAAKEFVSVQPMNLPSGLVFYLDFKYGTAQPGFQKDQNNRDGNPFGSPNADDSLFGVTTTTGDANGGLYGAGRFGYSINDVSGSAQSVTTASIILAADVNFDGAVSASLSSYRKVAVPTSSMEQAYGVFDPTAIRSFVLMSGSTDLAVYNAFTKLSGSNIEFVVAANAVTTGSFSAKVRYTAQPDAISRGDFEDNKGAFSNGYNVDVEIPELNLEMQSDPIVAKTRKLKAVWTPEFAQDLNAYHSIDAEAELTSMLSEYVSMEIDLEILDMLISAAPTTEYWSAMNNNVWNGSGFTQAAAGSVGAAGDGFYNTQGGWFQTLGTKLQKVSNLIHQKTLRGGANFLVTSPQVATVLESIPGFAAATDGTKLEFAAGVQKIGAIENRYTVYKNPYMKENVILMGFRGAQFLETGAVFSPYIPLIMTPLVYDPINFTPRKGVMTRYAKKVVRPEFYGKVYVHGLNTL